MGDREKDAFFFSHDSNAYHDPKIKQMRSVYGAEGYGWYWIFVEAMRNEQGYKLSMQGKYVWNAFASEMYTDAEKIHAFVEDCIAEFKLFESDGSYFWSNSLIRRMDKMDKKSESARRSAAARWDRERDSCERNANAPEIDAKKKRKEKEIKELGVVGGVDEIVQQEQEARIYSFYQKNIGLLAPHQAEVIASYLTDGIEPEAILEILKDAVGKDTPWDWIKKVLNATFDRGIKSLEQYKAHKLERETRDKKRGKRNGRTEGHSGQDSEDAGSKENGIDDRYQFPLPGEPGTGTEA